MSTAAIVLHAVDRFGKKHKIVFNCPIVVTSLDFNIHGESTNQSQAANAVVLTPNATSYTYYVVETVEEIANLLDAHHGEDK